MCADLPRLLHHVKTRKEQYWPEGESRALTHLPTASILVCKVLKNKEELDQNCPYFDANVAPSELFRKGKADFPPGSYAVYRNMEGSTFEKVWFLMDNNLAIPEYLVEYDYVLRNPQQNKVADFIDTTAKLDNPDDEFISPKNIRSFQRELVSIYNTLVHEVSTYRFNNVEGRGPSLEIPAHELDTLQVGSIKPLLINYFKYCLSRPALAADLNENLRVQPPEEFEFSRLKLEDPASLQFANFSNLRIKSLSFIAPFAKLKVLVLSFNLLASLAELEELSELQRLDASHNRITSLAGLGSLPLEHLNLSHNSLASIESLGILELAKGTLREVNVLFNPFENAHAANVFLGSRLRNLCFLNNLPRDKFTLLEAEESEEVPITEEMLRNNSKMTQGRTEVWEAAIESVHLSHARISDMSAVSSLSNLRHLNLSHNRIARISSLSACKLLEELNLESNLLVAMSGVEGLCYLKKLELGKNKIGKVGGLDQSHRKLLQLSLEDNAIESLADFPELSSLVELYLGNNKIADSNQIKALTDLEKLIILDLSGNPVAKEESYRFFTLFLFRKRLRVLDGVTVDESEHQRSEEHFTGRLTEEILQPNLKGSTAERVVELELKNCSLKDFEDMFNERKFPMLSELDLAGNLFASLRMLGRLPLLKILVLQENRIDSLHCQGEGPRGLNGCENLEVLDVSVNQLKDFFGLQHCRLGQLKILKAARNEIARVEWLEGLKMLKELDLNHNRIRQFDPNSFEGRLPIKNLKVEDNGLRSLMHIQKLNRLQKLYANANKIAEFFDIEKLVELPYLSLLELQGNMISRKPGYRAMLVRKLPALRYLDASVGPPMQEITDREREDQALPAPPPPPNIPQLYAMPPNQRQVPVRLSSVNFDSVLPSNRLNVESLINQNLYNINPRQPPNSSASRPS